MTKINAFLLEERGAVTTDWVVLIGMLVGLALTTVSMLSGGVENLSIEIAEDFSAIDPSAPAF
jgi:Flp pilus assembly pilin Flp